jgi:hypothetical protein
MLGQLAAVGAGYVLSRADSSAYVFSAFEADNLKRLFTLCPPPLPGWEEYKGFLESLKLQHIPVNKILLAHVKKRKGVSNVLPPRELWENMVPTLYVADALSGALGEEVGEVASAYRSEEYNAQCPGAAKNSQHKRNVALDLMFRAKPATVAAAARKLRSDGMFKGGVGLYPTFTHVDTRGENADWGGGC